MKLDNYDIDVLVSGFPGKSVCHGSLGWGSIVLVRGHGRVALIDVGTFGMRSLLKERLAEHGLAPKDVTDVLLTHSHHDHAINWVLFKHARIVIGSHELTWALDVPWGEGPVAELYMKELANWPTLHRARDGEAVLPGITAHVSPGHTPGHLVYVLQGREHDIVFTGDAAKNRAELLTRSADMSYDSQVTKATIQSIWGHWTRKPGTILVPGHDLPMVQEAGSIQYLGQRQAAIRAWFGDTLEQTTVFQLTLPQ